MTHRPHVPKPSSDDAAGAAPRARCKRGRKRGISWRFIFYVNLPVGAIAFVVLAAALPSVLERRRHAIDYGGIVLLAVGLGSLSLMTSLGRTTHGWGSWQIVALAVIAVLGLAFSITATKEGGHQGPPLAVRRAPVGQALLSSRSVACRTPARFLCLRS